MKSLTDIKILSGSVMNKRETTMRIIGSKKLHYINGSRLQFSAHLVRIFLTKTLPVPSR